MIRLFSLILSLVSFGVFFGVFSGTALADAGTLTQVQLADAIKALSTSTHPTIALTLVDDMTADGPTTLATNKTPEGRLKIVDAIFGDTDNLTAYFVGMSGHLVDFQSMIAKIKSDYALDSLDLSMTLDGKTHNTTDNSDPCDNEPGCVPIIIEYPDEYDVNLSMHGMQGSVPYDYEGTLSFSVDAHTVTPDAEYSSQSSGLDKAVRARFDVIHHSTF